MLRISTFGILRKPAFQDALFLLENFLYRPERGKGKDAADSRDENAFNQQGSDSSRYSQNKKDPPAFRAPSPIIKKVAIPINNPSKLIMSIFVYDLRQAYPPVTTKIRRNMYRP